MDIRVKIKTPVTRTQEIIQATKTFCHKPGHQTDKCYTKFQALRNQLSQRSNTNGHKTTDQRKYCKFCEKDGHKEEKCLHWKR